MRSISLISSSLLPLAFAAACAPPAAEDSAHNGVQAGVSSDTNLGTDLGTDLGPELQAEPIYGSFDTAGGGYSAELPSFTARFEGDTVLLDVGPGQVSLRPGSFGRGGAGVEPSAAVAALGGCEGEVRDCHPRLELARGEVLEWWAVKDGGLEQGWTLSAAPEGRGELSLGVQVAGARLQVGAEQIGMQLEGGGQLLVSGLLAWDADGQLLPARFEAEEGGFRVMVDDRGARYPIEVDPTYTTINFDDRSAPCYFVSASTPATFYSSVGLTLSSAAFEVLNECGNFSVAGHTAPNFLAWNTAVGTGLSETFTFSPPATSVSLNAGSSKGGTGTLVAYDSAGGVITSSSISIGTTLLPISVSATSLIDHVIFTATGSDGVVDDLVWVAGTDADGDGYIESVDCDDSDASINPGATEICDAANVDEDCDGSADDADSSVSSATKGTWYQDNDSDGYGGTVTTSTCDMPSGYLSTSTDCDDTKAAINPGATEVCDATNTDEDCDGLSDDADSSVSSATKGTWYRDADSDGYAGTATTSTCDMPSGYLTTSTDCDDTKAAINPGATEVCDASNTDEDCDGLSDDADSSVSSATKSTWYRDADSDGYAGTTTTSTCDLPSGYLTTSTDCDDTKAAINPGATEICDPANTDEDCDGLSDDADSSVSSATKGTWYRDADSDGYAGTSTTSTCDIPSGYLTTSTDCDDTKAAINPGATEVCDASNTDEDCDGLADDADSSVSSATKSSWYRDSDSDGYGGTAVGSACDLPSGYSATSTDCDDAVAAVNPGATEVCDASDTDEDCDGLSDDADSSVSAATYSVFYADTDADTFGDPATPISLCDETLAAVDDDTDCDDTEATVYPGAPEITGDGIDQDCDEGELCYTDGDGDGWHTDVVVDSLDFDCADPGEALGSAPGDDCDDTDPAFHPGASETDCSDPTDYNCDGSVAYDDADSDGFAACLECDDGDAGVNPDATEVCDSVDNDCDGTADGPTAIGAVDWFADQDGDTYTDPTLSTLDCTAPEGYAAASAEPDCDDADEAVNPSAAEGIDDALDQDCDGLELCFLDFDDDGYRPDETSTAESADLSCAGEGVATTEEPTGDCDDHNPDAWPGAPEIGGDEIDQDCDGEDTPNDDDSGNLPEDTAATVEDTADGAAEEGGTTDGKGGCACAVAATRPASSLGAWLLGALIGLRTLGRRRRSA